MYIIEAPFLLLFSHATLKLSATVSEFKTKFNFYALISHLSFPIDFLRYKMNLYLKEFETSLQSIRKPFLQSNITPFKTP